MTVILSVSDGTFFEGVTDKTTSTSHKASGTDHAIRAVNNRFNPLISEIPSYAGDTLYFKAYIRGDFLMGNNEDGYFFNFQDINGNPVCVLDVTNGYIRISAQGDSIVYGDATQKFSVNVLEKMVISIVVTAASITTALYVNNALFSTATVSNTVANFGIPRVFHLDPTDNYNVWYLSGFMFATHDISELNMLKEEPSSIDPASDWIGTLGTLLDDDLGTGMSASLSGEKLILNNSYAGTDSISELNPTFILTAGGLGPQSYKIFLLIGGVYYYGPDVTIPANSSQIASHSWDLYPVDNTAWDAAKVLATQFGVETIA